MNPLSCGDGALVTNPVPLQIQNRWSDRPAHRSACRHPLPPLPDGAVPPGNPDRRAVEGVSTPTGSVPPWRRHQYPRARDVCRPRFRVGSRI